MTKESQMGINYVHIFRLHKTRINPEVYVTNVPRYGRTTLARLRCGSLPLKIETGRYTNVHLEDRICELCNSNEVEDEMHFAITCPFYNDIRFNLLEAFNDTYADFNDRSVLEKYCIIMSVSEVPIVNLVASTLHKMYLRRQSYV